MVVFFPVLYQVPLCAVLISKEIHQLGVGYILTSPQTQPLIYVPWYFGWYVRQPLTEVASVVVYYWSTCQGPRKAVIQVVLLRCLRGWGDLISCHTMTVLFDSCCHLQSRIFWLLIVVISTWGSLTPNWAPGSRSTGSPCRTATSSRQCQETSLHCHIMLTGTANIRILGHEICDLYCKVKEAMDKTGTASIRQKPGLAATPSPTCMTALRGPQQVVQ